jgi:hypothetical protein
VLFAVIVAPEELKTTEVGVFEAFVNVIEPLGEQAQPEKNAK